MGSYSSPSNVVISEHSEHASMWVVNVWHFLDMRGMFKPHEVLQAEGLLDLWSPKTFTIFVSHQWLSHHHPDPHGVQLRLLQDILRKLMARKLKIDNSMVAQWNGATLTEAQFDQIGKAYLWMDFFCIPQKRVNQDGFVEKQLSYIRSIPNYLDYCNTFLALVPTAMHMSGGSCNLYSWLQRGWCRLELWCHFLSVSGSRTPIVVVKNGDTAQFLAPLFHQHPVHTGDFTLEEDRALCSAVITNALKKYMAETKDQTTYRLYLSLFAEITGGSPKPRRIDEFLGDFSFSLRQKGLGPVACAALSGDLPLIRDLAVAKASLNTFAPGMPETVNMPDFTPLHLAVWFRSFDLQVLEALLDLKADPNSSTMNVGTPLCLCRTVEAVEMLVDRKADVNCQGKFILRQKPIHGQAAFGAPCEVLAKMLELKADVLGGRGGLASLSPLHNVAYSGDSDNDLRSAQLLLENRADINQVVKPQGVMKMFELIYRAYGCCCRSEPSIIARAMMDLSTTPVGCCALYDNERLLIFLLRAGADKEIKNNRGKRAVDIARSENLRAILQDPSSLTQAIYSLEVNSETVTQSF